MFKTQEEARQTWCPFVSKDYLDGSPFGGKPTCIASGCMAWRWAPKHSLAFWDRTDDDGNPEGGTAVRQNWESDTPRGYCGLAGMPR